MPGHRARRGSGGPRDTTCTSSAYERPFRLPSDGPRLHFHPVVDQRLRAVQVSRLHLAAVGAHGRGESGSSPGPASRPLCRAARDGRHPRPLDAPAPTAAARRHDAARHRHDAARPRSPAYAPAIRHALTSSDAVTAVSESLKRETQRVLDFDGRSRSSTISSPRARRAARPKSSAASSASATKSSSSTRPTCARASASISCWRAVARVRPREAFKLLMLAGERSRRSPSDVRRLGLTDRVIVREKVHAIEDYLQVADVGLYTSDAESFCLSILEAMCFGCPSVSTRVGGIPEVVEDDVSGLLVPCRRRRRPRRGAGGPDPRQAAPRTPWAGPRRRARASGSRPRSSCRATKRSTGGCAGDGRLLARPRYHDHAGHERALATMRDGDRTRRVSHARHSTRARLRLVTRMVG